MFVSCPPEDRSGDMMKIASCIMLLVLLGGGGGGGECAEARWKEPGCVGDRTVMTHLFNWRWDDIAAECERFLGPKGYCGVQVSPPNEHRIVNNRPWWERYQPVSYKLDSRSGSRSDFINMVNRCNAVNVKIYVDAVINHMTGMGASGWGTGGSYFNADNQQYDGVPYSSSDFHQCGCSPCCSSSCNIDNYGNADEVRNCRLLSLIDLSMGTSYVRGKIIDFFNDMRAIGVAGFRVDACKHMWPADLDAIYRATTGDPFIFQEVIDQGGEPITARDYTHLGRVTEFKYGKDLSYNIREGKLNVLRDIGESWGMLPGGDTFIFVDNHDNQRGHGGGGTVITHKEPKLYKMANAFMLAHPYGFPRVMSSYFFDDNDKGPPSNGDAIANVPINPDDSCGGGWTCEHRWRQIYNMVGFRNVVWREPLSNWWDNGSGQMAFSRGNQGFIAMTASGTIDAYLTTGLSSGTYCDVISGNKVGSSCTGNSITVDGGGGANIYITSGQDDPMIAIHTGSKI